MDYLIISLFVVVTIFFVIYSLKLTEYINLYNENPCLVCVKMGYQCVNFNATNYGGFP